MSPQGKMKGRDSDELAEIIVKGLPRRRLALPGARLGWSISSIAPGILQRIVNRQ
jgi:hypothetical protein